MNFNTNSPTVKRLLAEMRGLQLKPEKDFVAGPVGDDLFTWHFTIKGPPDSPFQGGIYHGKIIFPQQYPLKPPDIYFLTPNGRFEINKKICLTMTSYHPDEWNPAWDVRTALTSIIAFMPTPALGAVGAIDAPDPERKALAKKSHTWHCPECSLTIEPDSFKDSENDNVNNSNIESQNSTSENATNDESIPENPNNENQNNETQIDETLNNENQNKENETPETQNNENQNADETDNTATAPTSEPIIQNITPEPEQEQEVQTREPEQQPGEQNENGNQINENKESNNPEDKNSDDQTKEEKDTHEYTDEEGIVHYNFEEMKSVPIEKSLRFVPLLDIPILFLFILLIIFIIQTHFEIIPFIFDKLGIEPI